MNTDAWLFLVSRNKYLDYRTIVAPDFIVDANASGLLSSFTDGDITKDNTAYYREIYAPQTGELTLVFRILEVTGKDINNDRNELLKDLQGRSISVIEGIVVKGIVSNFEINQKDFVKIHEQAMVYYQQFWECTSSFGVIPSTSFYLKYNTNNEKPIELLRVKAAGTNITTRPTENLNWEKTRDFPIRGRGKITSVNFHPRNNQLVVFKTDQQLIQVYNLDTKKILYSFDRELLYFKTSPCSVVFSPDGMSVATGYIEKDFCIDANVVKVWSLRPGKKEFSLHGHDRSKYGRIQTVCYSPKEKDSVIASGGKDNTIIVWDTIGKGVIEKLRGHSSTISSIVISSNGKILISADKKGIINIWNIYTGKLLKTIEAHTLPILSLTITSNHSKDIFASSSKDGTIKLWRMTDGQLLGTLTGHKKQVNSIAFGIDGKILASGSDDYTVRIWNIESLICSVILDENRAAVSSVAFSPNGQRLASCSLDGTLKIWQVKDNGAPMNYCFVY